MNIIINIIGIIIRIIAVKTLGRFYMRTLRKTNEHTLINKGIYKYLRHPGYSGNIMLFIGISLTMKNYITLVAVFVLIVGVYIYRIQVEEKMLIKIFGNTYIEYRKNTKKIIPLIY